jgi:hypothetical protein
MNKYWIMGLPLLALFCLIAACSIRDNTNEKGGSQFSGLKGSFALRSYSEAENRDGRPNLLDISANHRSEISKDWGIDNSINVHFSENDTFLLYSTTSVSGGSTIPNTFIGVDHTTGKQYIIGAGGQTGEQYSLDLDPLSQFLFGVNASTHPGIITKIDPLAGTTSVASTLTSAVRAIAFSPSGDLYALLWPRTLGLVDLNSSSFHPIGDIEGGNFVASIDFSPEGTLYAIVVHRDPFEQYIVTVDPASGAVTSNQRTGLYNIGDIDFAVDGNIYGTNYSWGLLKIDPITGTEVAVGSGNLGALGGLASIAISEARARPSALMR